MYTCKIHAYPNGKNCKQVPARAINPQGTRKQVVQELKEENAELKKALTSSQEREAQMEQKIEALTAKLDEMVLRFHKLVFNQYRAFINLSSINTVESAIFKGSITKYLVICEG